MLGQNQEPVTMHQLMLIEHLKENVKATKKELETVEIRHDFRTDVPNAMKELQAMGYVNKCVKNHRPAYCLV